MSTWGHLRSRMIAVLAIGIAACSGGGAAFSADGGAPERGVSQGAAAGTTYPAFRPTMPRLEHGRLPAIAAPVVVPVYFAGETERDTIDTSLAKWIASPYFAASVREYGVARGSLGSSIALGESAAPAWTLADIDAWLAAKLDGTHPELGPVDATTLASKVFVLFYPSSSVVRLPSGATSCDDFPAAHFGVTLPSGATVTYAIIPRCPAAPGTTALETLTASTTSQIVSAITNPISSSTSTEHGWAGFDAEHAAFALIGGGEVGTACASYKPITPPDLGVAIARTWSNAAAAAYEEPCLPARDAQPYFAAAPVVSDQVHLHGAPVAGVKVPLGATVKVPLDLFSAAPTSGAWTVNVTGIASGFHASVEPGTGANGDVLEVSIHNEKATSPTVLLVVSTLAGRNSLWFLVAGPS